jgi:CheY-like chemotaxis protein
MIARTLLMVDDDPDDFFLIQSALQDKGNGIDLRLVEDGEEMMDYPHHQGRFETTSSPRPFLILLDLNMPNKNGREALREIKGDPSLMLIPVVVFTTSNSTDDIMSCYRMGANSFIVKPASYTKLVKIMADLVDYWLNSVELPEDSTDRPNSRRISQPLTGADVDEPRQEREAQEIHTSVHGFIFKDPLLSNVSFQRGTHAADS